MSRLCFHPVWRFGYTPTTVIDGDQQRIGSDTVLWNHVHVMRNAAIGRNCVIGEGVHVGQKVKIGDRCKVQNGAQLFEGVQLEDDVFVGPHVVFTNVLTPRAFVNRKAEFKQTLVKRGASIGANATIRCGVTIGEYAMIGAGSVVTRDVGARELWYGVPATREGFVCKCGLQIRIQHYAAFTCACGNKYLGKRGDLVLTIVEEK